MASTICRYSAGARRGVERLVRSSVTGRRAQSSAVQWGGGWYLKDRWLAWCGETPHHYEFPTREVTSPWPSENKPHTFGNKIRASWTEKGAAVRFEMLCWMAEGFVDSLYDNKNYYQITRGFRMRGADGAWPQLWAWLIAREVAHLATLSLSFIPFFLFLVSPFYGHPPPPILRKRHRHVARELGWVCVVKD